MNSKLNFIFKRRSIRSYHRKDIPDELLKDLLEAGMSAPSACAKDPWDFIVVKNKENLKAISDCLPSGKMLAEASAGIVVCGDILKAHSNELSYMIQDCSAAIENILLAAEVLGLGACWLGVHPREDRVKHIKDLLEIPQNVTPLSVISLGYPAEQRDARTRYTDDAVHSEKW